MRAILLLFVVGSLLFCSCRTQRATYDILENIKDTTFRSSVYFAEPVVQKNDILNIQISSLATDPKVDQLYNLSIQPQSGTNQISGYLVSAKGEIELPRLGVLHVEGLKKSELEALIKQKIGDALVQPSVMVRFTNFRITVQGQVGAQAVLNIPNEKVTILEAIAMAGGVTQYGKIKEVMVLRENNGVRETGVLDLTSPEIFKSPYYQLQQNDVVLVRQTRYGFRQIEQQRISQQIGFITGIISTIALIIAITK